MQQKQQVQDRKPSLSGAGKEPSHSSSSSQPGLPTPPLTPPDRRTEDKASSNQAATAASSTPSRPAASVDSFSTPQPSASRGQCVSESGSSSTLAETQTSDGRFVSAGESLSATPLTMSARISALNIVGELLRKVGVRSPCVSVFKSPP